MTIDPGLPVALAVVLLLLLTVTMYRVGHLPSSGSTVMAAVRAVVQLSIAALVIAAVAVREGLENWRGEDCCAPVVLAPRTTQDTCTNPECDC